MRFDDSRLNDFLLPDIQTLRELDLFAEAAPLPHAGEEDDDAPECAARRIESASEKFHA